MISEWQVSNFKSIEDETNLSLAPLTLIAGTNSSGKSSLIQSMLLIAQTISSKVPSRSVLLNGTLTRLGQFDDLKSNNGTKNYISIRCTCKVLERESRFSRILLSHEMSRKTAVLDSVSLSVEFGIDKNRNDTDTGQIHPMVFLSGVTCRIVDRDSQVHKRRFLARYAGFQSSVVETESGNEKTSDNRNLHELKYSVEFDDESSQQLESQRHTQIEITGCQFDHFLPQTIEGKVNQLDERAHQILEQIGRFEARHSGRVLSSLLPFRINRETYEICEEIFTDRDLAKSALYVEAKARAKKRPSSKSRFQTELFGFSTNLTDEEQSRLAPILDVLSQVDNLKADVLKKLVNREHTYSESEIESFQIPREIRTTVDYFDRFFSSKIKYLGPLRVEPKPIYPLPTTPDPIDVGLTGEYTATVLELHKTSLVEYVEFDNFDIPIDQLESTRTTLQDAVSYWLTYMGVASSLETADKGKLGFELRVSTLHSTTAHDLTHVGVGVSQVMPILVMCLLADNDSTLIFEQPELHLHPSVQARLGDFFISMILSGRQCIVETHSEYLVNRIRLRIALSEGADLTDKIKILFAEKHSEKSEFREVVINEFGAIDQWPEDFFDETQRHAEELLGAAMRKRENKNK